MSKILGYPERYLEDLAQRSSSCYRPYQKAKKNGKMRDIDNPCQEMKLVQAQINKKILMPLMEKLPEYTHGARNGKSIYTNASCHAGAAALLSLDLESCFPNIRYDAVYGFYMKHCGCAPKTAQLLTKLTTFRRRLPQGSPSSASLCNLVLQPLLMELKEVADKYSLNFSQFIDDLFFSGCLPQVKEIRQKAIEIVKRFGWKINYDKVKTQTQGNRMSVTGVVVNTKLSAGRRRIRRIARDIMKCDPTAYTTVYSRKTGTRRRVYDKERIRGRIGSVNIINPTQGKHLQAKFDRKFGKH